MVLVVWRYFVGLGRVRHGLVRFRGGVSSFFLVILLFVNSCFVFFWCKNQKRGGEQHKINRENTKNTKHHVYSSHSIHWRSSGKHVRHTTPRSANSYSNGEWRERRSHPGINCPLRRPETATPRARARSRSARRPATRTDLCLDDHTGRVAGKYEHTHPHALDFDPSDHSMASL